MYPYKVVASNPQTHILALEDGQGQIHLGQAFVEPPPLGASLVGAAPAIGIVALRNQSDAQEVPIVLALLDCDPTAAVKLVGLTGLGEAGDPDPPHAGPLHAPDSP